MKNIFAIICREVSADPVVNTWTEDQLIKEGRQFWEDNKRWQENENLTPSQLLEQINHSNKVNTHTGYESI